MRNTSPRRRASSTERLGLAGLSTQEQRRQRERADRLSGKTPVPDGYGLCPICGAHVMLRNDGGLRSHRYKGFPCVGAEPYVDDYSRRTPCIYCGVPIKGTEFSIRMHIARDPLCPGNWLEDA